LKVEELEQITEIVHLGGLITVDG